MAMYFDRNELARNLPDAYSKGSDSNNAKILAVEKSALDQLHDAVSAIYDSLDIDKATGKTLDLYGDMVGQRRGPATDEQMRVLIRNKITRNLASGDYNSIVNAICVTFGCEPADVSLKETDEPCKVTLEGLPLSKLNESNIDISTAVQIINGLMPAGVFMEVMSFSGTFEFSGEDLELDESSGFADEDQTVGGYFGLVSDGAGSNLPV